MLFRDRADDGVAEESRADESLSAEPERAFIDEPLQTDFAVELGPVVAAGNGRSSR